MNEIRLEAPDSWDQIAAVSAFVDDTFVGMAKLSRDGDVATLADIVIEDRDLPIFPFWHWPKKRYNHRGKGYGTKLLIASINFCRLHKISELKGEVAGDLEQLLPWYGRHGFEVYDDIKIRLQIDV
jgi:GNAT superfamily N-acetyltransferase